MVFGIAVWRLSVRSVLHISLTGTTAGWTVWSWTDTSTSEINTTEWAPGDAASSRAWSQLPTKAKRRYVSLSPSIRNVISYRYIGSIFANGFIHYTLPYTVCVRVIWLIESCANSHGLFILVQYQQIKFSTTNAVWNKCICSSLNLSFIYIISFKFSLIRYNFYRERSASITKELLVRRSYGAYGVPLLSRQFYWIEWRKKTEYYKVSCSHLSSKFISF